MKRVTVICTNDYPLEVVEDLRLVTDRVRELQAKYDSEFEKEPYSRRKVYIHSHEVPVFTGE